MLIEYAKLINFNVKYNSYYGASIYVRIRINCLLHFHTSPWKPIILPGKVSSNINIMLTRQTKVKRNVINLSHACGKV